MGEHDEGVYLDHLEEERMLVVVQPGWADGKVILKAPHTDEIEISPHEIDEWLERHHFRPGDHQRNDLEEAVNAAIERGRRRAAEAAEPAAPQDTHLTDLWEQFERSAQALQHAASSHDRDAVLRAATDTLGLMRQIEDWSQGGRSWDGELEAWGRHLSTATTWTTESVQGAAWSLGEYGGTVAGWAKLQLDKRNPEVITSQHQFHDYAGQVREGLAPVQTWATETPTQ